MRLLVLLLLIGIAVTACRTKETTPPPGVFYPTPGMTPSQLPLGPQEQQITVQGEVRNSVVLWVPGLTLARALVDAEYIGVRDPQMIYIFRKDQAIRVDPNHLLSGIKDPVLQPGDIVELRR